MTHIMVDLETMGTSNNAAIIAIGAVIFNEKNILDYFYQNIDLASSVERGLKMDPGTVTWWLEQDVKARAALREDRQPLPVVLDNLSRWAAKDRDISEIELWGNGAAFDNVILRNAYKACGLIPFWLFRGDRCFRTIKALYPGVPMDRIGTHHNALDDAKTQALHLIKILRRLE